MEFTTNTTATNNVPEHEKIFDEICNKLNELSTQKGEFDFIHEETSQNSRQKVEKIQGQIKKFQTELNDSQDELKEKIKSLESVQFSNNDLSAQMKLLTEQLNSERTTNIKLNGDLAKSLELCLQLQLEIQGLKARALQTQTEDKKFSQSLLEKNKSLIHEIELMKALRDEAGQEFMKAKKSFDNEITNWKENKINQDAEIAKLQEDKQSLLSTNEELLTSLTEKEEQVEHLTQEIEKLSSSFNDIESSAQQQTQVMKNLMEVAENKIIEMKLALDKKTIEAQDYYSHLQQALTQCAVVKQENNSLKEYISKLNYFIQQSQAQAQAQVMAQQSAAIQQQNQPSGTQGPTPT